MGEGWAGEERKPSTPPSYCFEYHAGTKARHSCGEHCHENFCAKTLVTSYLFEINSLCQVTSNLLMG